MQLGVESDSVYLPGELWDSKSNLLLFFLNKYVVGAKVQFFLHIPTHFCKISYGLMTLFFVKWFYILLFSRLFIHVLFGV